MADVNVNIFTATRQRGGVSVPRSGVIVGDPLPSPVNPDNGGANGTVTSVAISGTDGIEVDSGSPVTTSGTITLGLNASTVRATAFPEAEERASNTVLFDKNYIIGNVGARSGNILFDFTGAKLGAWTEMRHADASAFTFPTQAMLMFDSADISTTVDNYFLFVLTDKTGTEVVKVFHAIEGGV